MSNWNIAGRPRSGPLAKLKCRARAAFRHEMKYFRENEDQLHSQSKLSKLRRGECNDFWKEIKALKPTKKSLPLTVKGILGKAILQTYGKIISVQKHILSAPLITEIKA